MKTFIYRISLLCTTLALLGACNDKSGNPEPVLTDCSGCQFLFTENADLASDFLFTGGSYRLFWADVKKTSIASQRLFIKAPMTGNSFSLTKADIVSHKVAVLDMCASCMLIGMKPISGSVKGTNTTPGAPADKARWLIEARIIRESFEAKLNLKDTVIVRQYFNANFVLD